MKMGMAFDKLKPKKEPVSAAMAEKKAPQTWEECEERYSYCIKKETFQACATKRTQCNKNQTRKTEHAQKLVQLDGRSSLLVQKVGAPSAA